MLAEEIRCEYPIVEDGLLQQILSPYIPTNTDYLKSSQLLHTWKSESYKDGSPLIVMNGEFTIPNSCYIQSTGHFNAVEFLICYNQLAYTLFGFMLDGDYFKDPAFHKLSPKSSNALAGVSIEDYFKDQLSSMLILKAGTRFKRAIDASKFTGTLSINEFRYKRDTIFIGTTCSFIDDNGGQAEGEVLLAYPKQYSQQR